MQEETINHRDGNLKIIACAGSGKTTVMSERIAKLIAEGANRDKIVAFTFTEKAAESLKFHIREKLEKWCPDTPYLGSMYIGTIHSFAFHKLKEIMPKYRNYEVLDETKRIIWVQKNYVSLGLNSIEIDRRLFDRIQRFLRTVDIIRDNEIPTDKLDGIPAFKEVYERYLEFLDNERYLDFSGIIYRLVKILGSNEGLCKKLRNNVEYLVVDEYQDVNHIQERLISMIATANGNLCVVGDDDQSIFEFQGAEVNNIINFESRYNNVDIKKLEENFRCPAEVITAARDLIRRNRRRIIKNMTPGSKKGNINQSQSGDICKVELETINDEVSFVINKIKELRGCSYYDDDLGRVRGLDYGDMAIIIRTRLSAQRFIEPLRRENIPFTLKGTGGLFQRPEIEFLRLIFCYIVDFAETFGTSDTSSPVSLRDLRNYFDTNLIFNHIQWDILSPKLSKLKEDIHSMDHYSKEDSKRRIFLQEFYYILMKALEVNNTNFSEDVMYDFGRLSELIAQFESVHGWINYFYFKQFVIFINGYAQNKTDEGGLDDLRSRNSVSILTVHQAKGLEFPVVFIPDVSVRRFPSQNRNRKPQTYLNDLIIDLERYCSRDEGERRLFYVAVTRTKKFLFITRSREGENGDFVNRSIYFTEFDHEIMINDEREDPTERIFIEPECKPNMELMPTSFSDLKHYINCPYSYLLQQMMGFTPAINIAYGYGLQVHNLVNYIHSKWENKPPNLEDVEALVESEFFLRFTRKEPYEYMKSKAKDILKTYVEEYGSEFSLKLETEKPFEFVLGGSLISGEIDLIQKIDPVSRDVTDVCILDFKTEKEVLERKIFNRLQLRLYALAGMKSLGINPLAANIHYLTDNFRQEVDISQDKLDETKESISNVIESIKNSEFKACPSDACKNCDVRFICSENQFANI